MVKDDAAPFLFALTFSTLYPAMYDMYTSVYDVVRVANMTDMTELHELSRWSTRPLLVSTRFSTPSGFRLAAGSTNIPSLSRQTVSSYLSRGQSIGHQDRLKLGLGDGSETSHDHASSCSMHLSWDSRTLSRGYSKTLSMISRANPRLNRSCGFIN
jgi:hypothetical protein